MFVEGINHTKKLIQSCDLFYTTELLRYKKNPQFKTMNGGCLSLLIIISLIIFFTQAIINTSNLTNITFQSQLYEDYNPSYFSTRDTSFLFTVGLNGFNLNDPTIKYFNVILHSTAVINGVKSYDPIPLVPCVKSEWAIYNHTLGDVFDRLGLNQWLCLPQNRTFEFEGKYSSKIFKYLKISVANCTILSGDNRTCVNSSIIDNYITTNGPIQFNYYFLNTVINPGVNEYLGYYLEDKNYFTFTRSLGTTANLFISNYNILTDKSLWPVSVYNEDNGGIVYESAQTFVYTPSTDYIKLYIRKSSLSLTINRSFKKYDETLSYIGGLFSMILVCLIGINKYNQYSYEMEIASNIYKYKKKEKIKAGKFNFFSYIIYVFYCILDFFQLSPKWDLCRHFEFVRQEIGKQLDVKLMIRKIAFLEDCIQYIFDDYELKCLHLKGRMTLQDAAKIRKRYSSRGIFFNLKKKNIEKQSISACQMEKTDDQEFNMQDKKRKDKEKNSVNQKKSMTSNNQQGKANKYFDDALSSDQSQFSNESQQNKFYGQCISSLKTLRLRAEKGNSRCQRILESMDSQLLEVDQNLKLMNYQRSVKDVNTNILRIISINSEQC